MPVEVLISIVKDWYKWLVSGLVHLLSNDLFRRTGLVPCNDPVSLNQALSHVQDSTIVFFRQKHPRLNLVQIFLNMEKVPDM